MSLRLGVFATHPIQYLAPLWRRLAAEPDLDLRVHFFSDCSVRGEIDPGFGVPVAWDVPLLEGYPSVFLDRAGDRHCFRRAFVRHPFHLLRSGQFDWAMVHGYTHPFELQMILAARRCGARTLMRGEFTDSPRPGRSWIKGVLRRLFLRWLYRHVDAFCCLGKNGRDHLLSYGIADSRLSSSPYAVDNEVFEQQRLQFPRAAMRTALGIERDCLAVLFSGKMIPRKAPGLLVEAIRRLGMGDTRSIHLIMVGEGPLRSEVESLARSVLGNRLNMPGFVNQSQLGRYFAAADVLVLPSHFETWGLVVNEAMLFGLPAIVSSNVGCHADLVVPGKTGLVFPAGDATGLATCLRRCLCRGDELVRMGRGAKAHIAKYSIEASARGILSAIFGRSSPVGKTCCILPPHPTRSHTNLTRQF